MALRSYIAQIGAWLGRLVGIQPRREPQRQPPTGPAGPQPVTRKVSLIIFDPTVPGGRRLSQALGWNDSDRLARELIADLREVSHGYANYEIVERILADEFPVKMDGFRYTGEEYLRCWQARAGFHRPDDVDYLRIVQQFDLAGKVNRGEIDEVWTVSFPYAGFYESRMAGPGAFWCNAPPLENTGARRRFVIMAFNYERGVGEMLESYGHRAESILERVHAGIPEPQNLWKRFTCHEKVAPGRAEVGNVHFAPNSRQDYDWGNPAPVMSRANAWRNFPDLNVPAERLDSRAWGGGDMRAHHRWWFSLLPHTGGQTHGISNHWWEYIVDPNLVR